MGKDSRISAKIIFLIIKKLPYIKNHLIEVVFYKHKIEY